MQVVDLEQGSADWLAWRRSRCMASEAPVIMGAAPDWWPVRTWEDLRDEKAGLRAERSEWLEKAAERGHNVEEAVREWAGHNLGEGVFVPRVVMDDSGRYGASLDGLAGDTWLEIKTPAHGRNSKLWKAVESISPLPDAVWWQLVHQAMVLDNTAVVCHLLVAGGGSEPLETGDIARWDLLAADMGRHFDRLRAEWERFLAGEPQHQEGPEWKRLAEDWRDAKQLADDANARLKDIRTEMIALLGDRQEAQANGVKVQRVLSKGRADWKKAASYYSMLYGAELVEDDWRGETIMQTRVTEV